MNDTPFTLLGSCTKLSNQQQNLHGQFIFSPTQAASLGLAPVKCNCMPFKQLAAPGVAALREYIESQQFANIDTETVVHRCFHFGMITLNIGKISESRHVVKENIPGRLLCFHISLRNLAFACFAYRKPVFSEGVSSQYASFGASSLHPRDLRAVTSSCGCRRRSLGRYQCFEMISSLSANREGRLSLVNDHVCFRERPGL